MTHWTTLVQRCRSTNPLLADDIASEFRRIENERDTVKAELACLDANTVAASAVDEARERCAQIADEWITQYGETDPEFVSARDWACDAVRDIADAIRGKPGTSTDTQPN